MATNTMLAYVFAATGVVDLVLAFALGDKLPPRAKTLLTVGGLGFLLLGALFQAGIVGI
jgi:hypothetical protein